MFCIHCGKDIPEESRFCRYCGKEQTVSPPTPAPSPLGFDEDARTTLAPLEQPPETPPATLRCKQCGNEVPKDKKFCGYCGAPLAQESVDSGAPSQEKPVPIAESLATPARVDMQPQPVPPIATSVQASKAPKPRPIEKARPPIPPAPQKEEKRRSPALLLGLGGGAALVLFAAIAVFFIFYNSSLLETEADNSHPTSAKTATLASQGKLNPTYTLLPEKSPTRSPFPHSSTPGTTSTPKFTSTPSGFPSRLVDSQGVEMVLINADTFMMGSEKSCCTDEQPVHQVSLDTYYMDVYETTYAQFMNFLNSIQSSLSSNSNYKRVSRADGTLYFCADCSGSDSPFSYDGSQFRMERQDGDFPVTNVTWAGALAYCTWRLTELPTEAQWEMAARGGLDNMLFPWGNEEPTCQKGAKNGAQFQLCEGDTVKVGSFSSNGFGLYDMAGNVWEWVLDWYDRTFYSSQSTFNNPFGPNTGKYRVMRGGSWNYNQDHQRVSYRGGYYPDQVKADFGIRCARTP